MVVSWKKQLCKESCLYKTYHLHDISNYEIQDLEKIIKERNLRKILEADKL